MIRSHATYWCACILRNLGAILAASASASIREAAAGRGAITHSSIPRAPMISPASASLPSCAASSVQVMRHIMLGDDGGKEGGAARLSSAASTGEIAKRSIAHAALTGVTRIERIWGVRIDER